MAKLPILCVDFDGVIHWYRDGWRDGVIYDDPVPGAFTFLKDATEHFNVHIYSSRSKTPEGIHAMIDWFQKHLPEDCAWFNKITFSTEKPPAFLTIDDRAFHFQGTWPEPKELRTFKPWNVK